jgi:ribosomal protein uS17
MSRDIGVPGVTPPKAKECLDLACPFHGSTKIRGKLLQGIVVSKKSKNTVILRRDYIQFIKKYQRYERRHSRLACHLPECLWYEINVGDTVLVGESRKISKTKSFIVIEKIASGAA